MTTRTAQKISNAAANLIRFNGGTVELAEGAYRVRLPKAAKWVRRNTYRLDGFTISFLASGSVVALP